MSGKISALMVSVMLLVLTGVTTGCQKSSINGHLDGRWQILEMERAGQVENVKDKQLYYNFYLHVCNLSYYGYILTDGNLSYENDIISLYFPYMNTPGGADYLRMYGIFTNPVQFHVDYISHSKLVMSNESVILTLRKF